MAANGSGKRSCCKCGKYDGISTCHGCRQSFCTKHEDDHRRELAKQMDDLAQQHSTLKRDVSNLTVDKALLKDIDRWETESIDKIRSDANNARDDLRRLTEKSKSLLESRMGQLASELQSKRKSQEYTEADLERWMKRLDDLRGALKRSSMSKISQGSTDVIYPIIIQAYDQEKPTKTDEDDRSSQEVRVTPRRAHPSTEPNHHQFESSYPSSIFGLTESIDHKLMRLLTDLTALKPMDKNGPMSGNCDAQTSQMEQFLTDTFDFKNIPKKHIVQGVRAFKLQRPPHSMDPNTTIHFPTSSKNAFTMTIKEIIKWQQSFKVYTSKTMKGMSKDFLRRALEGQSADGAEAFLMKYVVRISTCPILMEFDAEIISRKLDETWPHRIKLVSVTGIDFAGRKHDVNDILSYVTNWKDVYEVDRTGNKPQLANERDFLRKRGGAAGVLDKEKLFEALTDMARIRLYACDAEGVQVVVETGIGLGVFAGEDIGIAEEVQHTSALAIRTVLEKDAINLKNIRAVVFSLPIFDRDQRRRTNNPFNVFVEQFQPSHYKGRIPVLIADQDMHRLTVTIARHGFVVSELNPADSHGVFGEYWQNRGPAVEEKLALTTVGLLVQHHLINPHVLDPSHYYLV